MGRPRGFGVVCLWPGLADICAGRRWRGICLGGAATLLVNLALAAGWIWPGVLARGWLVVLWSGVGGLWLGAAATALWGNGGHERRPRHADLEGAFRQAVDNYLGGRWAEVEDRLKQLLRRAPEDCDALLHLATLYRRQGRRAESVQVLQACRRRDAEGKWSWEIARESERLMTR